MSLSLDLFTTIKTIRQVATVAVLALVTMSVSTSFNNAQTTEAQEEDVFKVIVTLFGVEPTDGNMVTFVTIDNFSKVKAFDAAKYYIPIEEDETTPLSTSKEKSNPSGIIELYYSFPNATSSIKSGDEFRVCSMVLKDLQMVCEVGENTPALRAENVDMYMDSAKFLKVEEMKGASLIEDDIDTVEEVVETGEDTESEETDEDEEEE